MPVRWLWLMVLILPLLVGCAKKDEGTGNANQASETSEHDAYVQETQHKLADLDARIDTLKSHLAGADAKAKKEMKQDLDELGVEREKARTRLEALRTATATGWDSLKASVGEALDSLDAKYDRARARLH
jgi:type IV pilus biogenesis protein CpaD/CtpE